METLTYAQIQEILGREEVGRLPKMRISVLRNVTLEPLIPYLKFMAYQIGFSAEIAMGDYDNVVQEALGANPGVLESGTDCVLVFLKMENLSWNLARNFAACAAAEVRGEIERIRETVGSVLAGVRRRTDALILWHGFESPLYPALGIWDGQTAEGQTAVVQELNGILRKALGEVPNAYFVDLNPCLARLGAKAFYDDRYWHIGRSPYGREAMLEIAGEAFKFIRSLKGKNRKCLVLDCDNVLWGGIVGEDGISGIRLGKSYPGSPYYEFQQEVMNLYHRGVLIALCSKNNADDVWEVFRNHPDMILRENHIAAAEINWDDKATNLRRIASTLNIGLDSLVFVDDSDFEIRWVREAVPEVAALHFPKESAVEYRNRLAGCGLFDTLTVSAEDRDRGAMYRAEAKRKELQSQVADLETYLKSLEMVVEVRFADAFTLPRIAQLTQKTNQFNLTTRRYSEGEIQKYMESDRVDVISLKLFDSFGDSGIVGVCILKYVEQAAMLDTFLLSCRVLGRGVEDVFVIQALHLAKQRGCTEVIGEFLPTGKNQQVKDYYQNQGFDPVPHFQDFSGKRYSFSMSRSIRKEPSYFKEIRCEGIGKGYC